MRKNKKKTRKQAKTESEKWDHSRVEVIWTNKEANQLWYWYMWEVFSFTTIAKKLKRSVWAVETKYYHLLERYGGVDDNGKQRVGGKKCPLRLKVNRVGKGWRKKNLKDPKLVSRSLREEAVFYYVWNRIGFAGAHRLSLLIGRSESAIIKRMEKIKRGKRTLFDTKRKKHECPKCGHKF